MAHMLAAGRGLGITGLHRVPWKVGCKQKLFVVDRLHPVTLKELCRIKPHRGHPPLITYVPRHSPLNCALNDGSPPSSSTSPEGLVIISSKECPDGSILFVFGSPAQQVSEDLIADSGKLAESEKGHVCRPETSQNGPTTKQSPFDGQHKEVIGKEDSTVKEQSDSFSIDTPKKEPAEEVSKLEEGVESVSIDTPGHKNSEVQAVQSNEPKELESSESSEHVTISEGVLRLRSGGAIRPHPSKVKSGGEDAYLIGGDFWVGVADGVGGWAMSGIDSGLYSRELMKNCGIFAKSKNGKPNPKAVIVESVKTTKALGSCTAVLAALHNQTLYVANVGDSGFLVVREGKILARSKPMQHGFNFPYQIGSEGDDPATTETFEVHVATGDVLVLATDGVYDNLYEREIVDIINSGQLKGVEPWTVATWLVKLAHQAGLSAEGRSPFSDAANAAGYSYSGGKLDDATVVVSYIE